MKNTILIIALLSFGAVCSAADGAKEKSASVKPELSAVKNESAAALNFLKEQGNICAAKEIKAKAGQACKRGDKDDGRELKVKIYGIGAGNGYSGEKTYKQECKSGKWEFKNTGIKCFEGYEKIGEGSKEGASCGIYQIVGVSIISAKGMIMPKEGKMSLDGSKYSGDKAGQLCADSADASLKNERNQYTLLPEQDFQARKTRFLQCRLQKDNKWHTEVLEIPHGCMYGTPANCKKELVLKNRKAGDLCSKEEEDSCTEYNDPKFNEPAQCKKGYLRCVSIKLNEDTSC